MDEIAQLSEELTCQQVMLKSLEDPCFDDVEEEREEMRAEIARLQRLIDKVKRGKPPIEDEYSSSEDTAVTCYRCRSSEYVKTRQLRKSHSLHLHELRPVFEGSPCGVFVAQP
ncbi:hypothetical protein GMORB2_5133 [Geosmithia morbida]|uniref:Uncharacterized protein n=1 Tax=Geosmithia morbida TaxID=1094350 RepID=A0A9P4YXT0_9HYPO|nr:uncharacterized protein GMORB2_5133 [Geosmithia morbida]KAF4124467.1 hypothetical protein GMORB2_5133 [Geosmithia morbida]